MPPLEKNMAQSELAMAFRTMKAMEVGCKKIKYLFKACQPHDVTYKKLMTWLNVRSEKADYKQLTEEGRVDEFLDLQLKETDKPKAMNETEQTLNNVKQFDSERSQDYFNRYEAAYQQYETASITSDKPMKCKYAGDRGKAEAAIEGLCAEAKAEWRRYIATQDLDEATLTYKEVVDINVRLEPEHGRRGRNGGGGNGGGGANGGGGGSERTWRPRTRPIRNLDPTHLSAEEKDNLQLELDKLTRVLKSGNQGHQWKLGDTFPPRQEQGVTPICAHTFNG